MVARGGFSRYVTLSTDDYSIVTVLRPSFPLAVSSLLTGKTAQSFRRTGYSALLSTRTLFVLRSPGERVGIQENYSRTRLQRILP